MNQQPLSIAQQIENHFFNSNSSFNLKNFVPLAEMHLEDLLDNHQLLGLTSAVRILTEGIPIVESNQLFPLPLNLSSETKEKRAQIAANILRSYQSVLSPHLKYQQKKEESAPEDEKNLALIDKIETDFKMIGYDNDVIRFILNYLNQGNVNGFFELGILCFINIVKLLLNLDVHRVHSVHRFQKEHIVQEVVTIKDFKVPKSKINDLDANEDMFPEPSNGQPTFVLVNNYQVVKNHDKIFLKLQRSVFYFNLTASLELKNIIFSLYKTISLNDSVLTDTKLIDVKLTKKFELMGNKILEQGFSSQILALQLQHIGIEECSEIYTNLSLSDRIKFLNCLLNSDMSSSRKESYFKRFSLLPYINNEYDIFFEISNLWQRFFVTKEKIIAIDETKYLEQLKDYINPLSEESEKIKNKKVIITVSEDVLTFIVKEMVAQKVSDQFYKDFFGALKPSDKKIFLSELKKTGSHLPQNLLMNLESLSKVLEKLDLINVYAGYKDKLLNYFNLAEQNDENRRVIYYAFSVNFPTLIHQFRLDQVQLEFYITYYKALPNELRTVFLEQLLKEDSSPEGVKIYNILTKISDEAGLCQAQRLAEIQLVDAISGCSSAKETDIKLDFIDFNKKQMTSQYLNPELVGLIKKQLIINGELNKFPKNNKNSRHLVFSIQINGKKLWLKVMPHIPLQTIAAYTADYAFFNQENHVPVTIGNLEITVNQSKFNCPVQISLDAPGEVLSLNPNVEQLTKLSPNTMFQKVFSALLLSSSDTVYRNIICAIGGKEDVTLRHVDDTYFVPIWGPNKELNLRSIYFALPGILQQIPKTAVDEFLNLNIPVILERWAEDLITWEKLAHEIFKEKEEILTKLKTEHSDFPFFLTLMFNHGNMVHILRVASAVQLLLQINQQKDQSLRIIDIVSVIDEKLFQVLQIAQNKKESIANTYKYIFGENLTQTSGFLGLWGSQKSLTTRESIKINFPTQNQITVVGDSEKFNARQAYTELLTALNHAPIGKTGFISSNNNQTITIDANLWQLVDQQNQPLIQSQQRILDLIGSRKVNVSSLALINCPILTDQWLLDFVKNNPGIERIDIRIDPSFNSQKITQQGVQNVIDSCKRLYDLKMSGRKIVNLTLISSSLRIFHASMSNLETIILNMPHLIDLKLNGNNLRSIEILQHQLEKIILGNNPNLNLSDFLGNFKGEKLKLAAWNSLAKLCNVPIIFEHVRSESSEQFALTIHDSVIMSETILTNFLNLLKKSQIVKVSINSSKISINHLKLFLENSTYLNELIFNNCPQLISDGLKFLEAIESLKSLRLINIMQKPLESIVINLPKIATLTLNNVQIGDKFYLKCNELWRLNYQMNEDENPALAMIPLKIVAKNLLEINFSLSFSSRETKEFVIKPIVGFTHLLSCLTDKNNSLIKNCPSLISMEYPDAMVIDTSLKQLGFNERELFDRKVISHKIKTMDFEDLTGQYPDFKFLSPRIKYLIWASQFNIQLQISDFEFNDQNSRLFLTMIEDGFLRNVTWIKWSAAIGAVQNAVELILYTSICQLDDQALEVKNVIDRAVLEKKDSLEIKHLRFGGFRYLCEFLRQNHPFVKSIKLSDAFIYNYNEHLLLNALQNNSTITNFVIDEIHPSYSLTMKHTKYYKELGYIFKKLSCQDKGLQISIDKEFYKFFGDQSKDLVNSINVIIKKNIIGKDFLSINMYHYLSQQECSSHSIEWNFYKNDRNQKINKNLKILIENNNFNFHVYCDQNLILISRDKLQIFSMNEPNKLIKAVQLDSLILSVLFLSNKMFIVSSESHQISLYDFYDNEITDWKLNFQILKFLQISEDAIVGITADYKIAFFELNEKYIQFMGYLIHAKYFNSNDITAISYLHLHNRVILAVAINKKVNNKYPLYLFDVTDFKNMKLLSRMLNLSKFQNCYTLDDENGILGMVTENNRLEIGQYRLRDFKDKDFKLLKTYIHCSIVKEVIPLRGRVLIIGTESLALLNTYNKYELLLTEKFPSGQIMTGCDIVNRELLLSFNNDKIISHDLRYYEQKASFLKKPANDNSNQDQYEVNEAYTI